MAIELSNLTFTEQDDIVPSSGVKQILTNKGATNTLAGNDTITGFYNDDNSDPSGVNGIYNSGTFNTADGNDIITGRGAYGAAAIYNYETGTFNTGVSLAFTTPARSIRTRVTT